MRRDVMKPRHQSNLGTRRVDVGIWALRILTLDSVIEFCQGLGEAEALGQSRFDTGRQVTVTRFCTGPE